MPRRKPPATAAPTRRRRSRRDRRGRRRRLAALRVARSRSGTPSPPRAEADRVDADAAIGGLLRGVERRRAGVARAVGQQDDDVRRIGPLRHRRRLGAGGGGGDARRDVRVDLGDRVDRLQDAAADRRPAPGDQALDRVLQRLPGRSWAAGSVRRSRRMRRCRSACRASGCWMNDSAAAWAASRRLGEMSVEHMLRETSMARMIVVWLVGTLTIATGRASATIRLVSASRKSANGRWRRQRVARQRLAHQRQAGVAHGKAPPPAQHPDIGRDQQRDQPQQEQEPGPKQVHLPPPMTVARYARRSRHAAEPEERERPADQQDEEPAPAKSEVTSVFSGLITSCGSRFS